LISVLVILAILLSIALPALTNLSKASAINAAAREVSNTLSLARQFAITHRVAARVVFPYSATVISSLAPAYLSYAVMTNDANYAGTWTYVTKWEQLPTGAVFLNGTTAGSGSLNILGPPTLIPFPYSNPPSPPTALLAYIEFGPTGAASGSQPSMLTIESGFIDNNRNPQRTAPYNCVTNIVDNIVGHIQVIHP
jgi:hypothetical protein